VAAARAKWGENRFVFPQPTFLALFKEQCMEPFFVFQGTRCPPSPPPSPLLRTLTSSPFTRVELGRCVDGSMGPAFTGSAVPGALQGAKCMEPFFVFQVPTPAT